MDFFSSTLLLGLGILATGMAKAYYDAYGHGDEYNEARLHHIRERQIQRDVEQMITQTTKFRCDREKKDRLNEM